MSKEELAAPLARYKNLVKTQWVAKKLVHHNALFSINIGLGRDVSNGIYSANAKIWEKKVNCYNKCVQAYPSPSQKPTSADFKRYKACESKCARIKYMKCP